MNHTDPRPARCPRCDSSHFTRNGFKTTAAGRHVVWRCSNHHSFTGHEKFSHADEETKALAIKMATEGLSNRAVARIVGVYSRAVDLWVQKKANRSGGLTGTS